MAQAPLSVYTDHLVNGFDDWSWATHNLSNINVVHSGTDAISVTAASWEALSLHHADFDATVYGSLTFWANGGSSGGQLLQIIVELGGVAQAPYLLPGALTPTWHQYNIPLTSLAAANKTNLSRISFQLRAGGSSSTFYVDDIQLTAKPAPIVHLSIDAAQPVRTVDARMFGVNTAIWDGNFDTPQTVSLLKEAGLQFLRFPGGSLSDEYHWASNKSSTNTWQWATSFANFVHVATNIGAQVIITVNYGSGTAAEAASWVRSANADSHYGFKYWEIGNECYGTWETDTNVPANDAYTYALRARDYLQQMKAVDPTIKVGVVATPGEDSFVNNNSTRSALNPRTGQTHYGWTPVLLATLKSLGVTPDFLIHHRYPEYTDPNNPLASDSDPFLLQTPRAWTGDAAGLRQQITDYFGSGGTNIELLCTENNSDAGAPGRQSTSLVNGVYYADSLGQLMQTELNSLVWWDLRNGADTKGGFDSTLYGWRNVGDLGMIGGLSTRYPPFYAAKLMQHFARAGDTIVSASSDYPLLSTYAARRTNGTLSLLVINKDTVTNFSAQISLTGFSPDPSATLHTFGIPQDEAARTNGLVPAQDIALTNFPSAAASFNYSFSPLSLTLFTFVPASTPVPSAARLAIIPLTQPSGREVILQLQGQAGATYVLQSSPDLALWTAISTNTVTGSFLNLTNPSPASAQQFYRAMWQP
jgi:hypothetical protein